MIILQPPLHRFADKLPLGINEVVLLNFKAMNVKLTKSNCSVAQAESGNLYISHPQAATNLRFYAEVSELKADPDWRSRVSIRNGDYGMYAFLAKSALKSLKL